MLLHFLQTCISVLTETKVISAMTFNIWLTFILSKGDTLQENKAQSQLGFGYFLFSQKELLELCLSLASHQQTAILPKDICPVGPGCKLWKVFVCMTPISFRKFYVRKNKRIFTVLGLWIGLDDCLKISSFQTCTYLSTKIILLSLHSVWCTTTFVLISVVLSRAFLPTQMANI